MLKALEPSEDFFGIVRTMFKATWDHRLGQAKARSQAAQTAMRKLDKQIDSLVDRIVESQNDRVTKAYEARIAKLEREKIKLEENIAKSGKSRHSFEELFELSMSFLASPWKIWDSGDYSVKRMVLRLAFKERIAYSRNDGLRKPKRPYHSRL